MRIRDDSFDTFAGIHSICIVARADGTHHLEKTSQDLHGGRPSSQVYEGRLPEKEFSQLIGVVDNPQFRQITGDSPALNTLVFDAAEHLGVLVARDDGVQHFDLISRTKKSMTKAVDPLKKWLKTVEKFKLPPTKGGVANGCRVGTIVLHGTRPVPLEPK